ncbi:hypothetical protein BJ508DRAFT_306753 [Ascobolus immersus RN42]|uniref:Uncharacterized protein n=1 Tax=Ascobolus immersus RN42 TaxID=1160509 RepID=A0A3N4I6Z6_ASCIM|nr:hypothetical protein BJ508DRAFT_306753 [Ascobolus immersus RN42]
MSKSRSDPQPELRTSRNKPTQRTHSTVRALSLIPQTPNGQGRTTHVEQSARGYLILSARQHENKKRIGPDWEEVARVQGTGRKCTRWIKVAWFQPLFGSTTHMRIGYVRYRLSASCTHSTKSLYEKYIMQYCNGEATYQKNDCRKGDTRMRKIRWSTTRVYKLEPIRPLHEQTYKTDRDVTRRTNRQAGKLQRLLYVCLPEAFNYLTCELASEFNHGYEVTTSLVEPIPRATSQHNRS